MYNKGTVEEKYIDLNYYIHLKVKQLKLGKIWEYSENSLLYYLWF